MKRLRLLLRGPRWVWWRLTHYSVRKTRITRAHLRHLLADAATDEHVLVVHVEDVGYQEFFPHRTELRHPVPKSDPTSVPHLFAELASVGSDSYPVVICMGLLEHVPEPRRLVDELHRVLVPGGRAVLSASAAFSIHEGPQDFFHFTPYGFRELFAEWTSFELLRGSSQPFETIAILLQRILLQTDMFPPSRLLVEAMMTLCLRLDRAVITQYDKSGDRRDERVIDSMLPSNVQAIVVK